MEKSKDALGMIETRGFAAMVEAADAMVKAAMSSSLASKRLEGDMSQRSCAETWPHAGQPSMPGQDRPKKSERSYQPTSFPGRTIRLIGRFRSEEAERGYKLWQSI